MALTVLLLRKRIEIAKKNLEALRAKDADFSKREAEIEAAINEAAEVEGEEAAEAQKAVEEEAEKFDADKKAHEDAKANLENEIAEMEQELADAEAEQDTAPAEDAKLVQEEREDKKVMAISTRKRFFANLSAQERTAMFEREDV